MIRRLPLVVGAAGAVLALTGCSSSVAEPSTPVDAASRPTVVLTVGAASSLTNVFAQIGEAFMRDHPGVTLRFSFAASSSVAAQIEQGAPLDVFASAGTTAMQPVADAGLVSDVRAFATNSLGIATPPGNPAGVSGLEDLPGVSVLVCQPQVPCGGAASALFDLNELAVEPVSLEPDVRSVLTKIEADEADAGIVYVTDLREAGDRVVGIEIPAARNVSTTYQAATVTSSPHAAEAGAFVAFLTSPEAQAVLSAAAFAPAP